LKSGNWATITPTEKPFIMKAKVVASLARVNSLWLTVGYYGK